MIYTIFTEGKTETYLKKKKEIYVSIQKDYQPECKPKQTFLYYVSHLMK